MRNIVLFIVLVSCLQSCKKKDENLSPSQEKANLYMLTTSIERCAVVYSGNELSTIFVLFNNAKNDANTLIDVTYHLYGLDKSNDTVLINSHFMGRVGITAKNRIFSLQGPMDKSVLDTISISKKYSKYFLSLGEYPSLESNDSVGFLKKNELIISRGYYLKSDTLITPDKVIPLKTNDYDLYK